MHPPSPLGLAEVYQSVFTKIMLRNKLSKKKSQRLTANNIYCPVHGSAGQLGHVRAQLGSARPGSTLWVGFPLSQASAHTASVAKYCMAKANVGGQKRV